MRIVVTGAAGAIGSHVAEALKKAGHDIVGIDAVTDYYDPAIKEITIDDLKKAGIPVLRLDLATDDVSDALKGADIVFNFAAQPGISAATPFEDYAKNNITATYKLLEAARKLPSLKLLVHISTSSIYGAHAGSDETAEPKPTSFYGVTKLAAEQLALSYAREKGMPVSVLRLFSVYGERERPEKLYHKAIKNILNDEPLTLFEGAEKHRRSFTHVSDVVAACLLVLKKIDASRGEIFNIGGGESTTTGEGLKLIEQITGKKLQFKKMPKRAGDQLETSAQIAKARKILGYEPKIAPKEGLRRQVEWHKKKLHKPYKKG